MTKSASKTLKLVTSAELPPKPSKSDYRKELKHLQIGLVKLQRNIIEKQRRVVVVLEGRDAAGKDGAIKRIIKHLSPRETRVVALGAPTEREELSWYYNRWASHLPASGEWVLYNRSWYNRAGVERVMGFCTQTQYDSFFETVGEFEGILINSGFEIVKYYLDITKDEQSERMVARRQSPFKQWKISKIDEKALALWDAYTSCRDEMLTRTHTEHSPWTVVRANNKRLARLNIMHDILHKFGHDGISHEYKGPDPRVVFPFEEEALADGRMAS